MKPATVAITFAMTLPAAVLAHQKLTATQCINERTALEARAAALADQKQFWKAHMALQPCAVLLNDKTLADKAQAYEVQDYEHTLRDPKATADDKLRALERLSAIDPARAAKHQSARSKLEQQATADDKRAAQREAARRRKEGVSIGMSQNDVLASNRGRPERVNTTIMRDNRRNEQWVYGGGNYLYFEDGVLVSIQTGR